MATKTPVRTDRIHNHASVGSAEKRLADIAKLPDGYKVRIVDDRGRDVRGNAKIKNLGRK